MVVCFFGDGASNQGTFHESLNLASIWKLPIVFACVNNCYGMSMHVKDHMNISDISLRASSYGIPGRRWMATTSSRCSKLRARRGSTRGKSGPILLVLNTYRIMGHSKSDSGAYRSKEEVEEWKRKDPIKRMKEYLIREGSATDQELAALDGKAERVIQEAVAFAEASAEPSLDTVEQDVYA